MNCFSRIFLLIHLFLVCYSIPSFSQDTAIVRMFGGPGSEFAIGMKAMPDTGLVLTGITNYYGAGGNSVYMVRTDKNGMHRWSRVIGGLQIEQGNDIVMQGDSVFFVAGYSNNGNIGGYDGYVIKTDTMGNLIWEKFYGGTDWDFFNSVSVFNDGSALLCGRTYSFTNGGSDGYVVKIDQQGNILWSRNYGRSGDDNFNDCLILGSNIFFAGTSLPQDSSNTTGYLVKTDMDGNIVSEYFLSSQGNDGFKCIAEFNGSLLVGGYSSASDTTNRKAWILKADVDGNMVANFLSGSSEDEFVNDIVKTSNQQIIFTGQKNPSGLGLKSMFMGLLDSSCNFLLGPSFGGVADEEGFKAVHLPDNRTAFCGYTTSYGYGNEDAYLVILTLDTTEFFLDTLSYEEQLSPIGIESLNRESIRLFPNPGRDIICVSDEFNDEIACVKLYSLIGTNENIIAAFTPDCFDLSRFSRGIYIYEIIYNSDKRLRGKLILQ